jgi:mannose-1-phosphate guanylyltransferase/mannose-6-phosphate isomerase
MPADHVIHDLGRFQETVLKGIPLAMEGRIVTFGVVPDRPETGYGYIHRGKALGDETGAGGYVLEAFVEKPDRDTAAAYLAAGTYFWNSGLFMMRASVWLEAIACYQPEIARACREAWEKGHGDGNFFRVERSAFEACPANSIDYAVMEKIAANETENGQSPFGCAVLPLDAGWSDIGAWPALLEVNVPNTQGNVLHGDVYAHGVQNSLLISEHRFLAAVGVRDVIAVETADAVLVMHKDHSQEVRRVVDWLKTAGREEGQIHRRVYRPWGYYERLDQGERFQVKRLLVKPGAMLSLQMHHHRAEHWVVVRGTAKVTRNGEEFLLTENQSTYISLGVTHRLENPGKVPLEIIEVQSGSYLGEDDIVRFEDRYHREKEG